MSDPDYIPQSQCTLDTCSIQRGNILYVPSLAGNAIYLAAFALLTLAQLLLGIRNRTWVFMIAMLGGLGLEIIGYAGRILLHHNIFNFDYFVTYLVCLTIGPAFFSGAVYLCLARVISVHGAHFSRLSPRAYKITFITCDFIALVLQSVGGAIASIATTKSLADTGVNIMIAGLVSQVASLTLFMALWLELVIKLRKTPENAGSTELASLRTSRRFVHFQRALAAATVLIFVRSIYRVVELAGGFGGTIANNEPGFMVFEGPLIIAAATVLTVWHPGRIFGRSSETAGTRSKPLHA